MTVAQALDKQIQKQGWTQEEAAEKIGLSRFMVNQILNGWRRITVDTALKLEKVFRVPAEKWLEIQMREDLETARKGYKIRQVTR